MKEDKKPRFNFLKKTGKFSIAGIFIPGFTAILIIGFHGAINALGVECAQAWTLVWAVAFVAIIIKPIVFIRNLRRTTLTAEGITKRLWIFNLMEYIFLQAAGASFFTNGNTLCYVRDGQNGLEFAFTGWMAIPFLLLVSLIFSRIQMNGNK